MDREEFLADLPIEVLCDHCGRKHENLNWSLGRFGARDWIGMCVVRCEKCSRTMVAAAGTSHEAHHRAQMMRWELISQIDPKGINRINRFPR